MPGLVDVSTYQDIAVFLARFCLVRILKMRLDCFPHLSLRSDQLFEIGNLGAQSTHLMDLPIPSSSVTFGAASQSISLENTIFLRRGTIDIE